MTDPNKIDSFDQEVAHAFSENTDDVEDNISCVLYGRRWFMLLLFALYGACNTMQFLMYSIVADAVGEFYSVTPTAVTWTSTIYLLVFVLFAIPGEYLQQKLGVQLTVFVGINATCLGTWINVFGIYRNIFWLLLVGQAVVGAANVFVLPMIPKIAAVWFGANEVGKACSLGMIGMMLGTAIGFVLPPSLMVNSFEDVLNIQHNLRVLVSAAALTTSVVLFLILIFFQDAPPSPPSLAQLKARKRISNISSAQAIKRILVNPDFRKFVIVYAINVGLLYTISILLSEIILRYYPDAGFDAGVIGLLSVITGILGSFICGAILDNYKLFRTTALVVCAIAFVALVLFTFTLSGSLTMVYVTLIVLGCTLSTLMTIGYEIGAEITYPEPENTFGNILSMFAQLFAVILTYVYSLIFNHVAEILANIGASALCAVALYLMSSISLDLKRHEAQTATPLFYGN